MTGAFVIFVIVGIVFLTTGILYLFKRCLFLISNYAIMPEKLREFLRIFGGIFLSFFGLGGIIVSLSLIFSWVVGVCLGLLIGVTIFSLIYFFIHKRSKKFDSSWDWLNEYTKQEHRKPKKEISDEEVTDIMNKFNNP